MSIEVKIPAVGESISSGTISVWHKKSGDFVKAGEPLFTLETDKVSTEITAEKDGVLTAHVPEGQEVKIGETVASIDESAPPAAAEPVAAVADRGETADSKSPRLQQRCPQPSAELLKKKKLIRRKSKAVAKMAG